MAPKKGVNEKVEKAKERKEEVKNAKESKAKKEAEDAFWQGAGEGAKTKAASKKEEAEKKAQEAAAKRAEAKRLAEQEEAALAQAKSSSAKQAPKPTAKITQFQLQQQREFEAQQREEDLREREMQVKREVTADRYGQLVDAENTNRLEGEVSARNLNEALAVLGVSDDAGPSDKHPEKRMKAAWAAFQEAQLPLLRQEKPGLKLTQYREMIWKMWQKSPENPMNTPPPKSP